MFMTRPSVSERERVGTRLGERCGTGGGTAGNNNLTTSDFIYCIDFATPLSIGTDHFFRSFVSIHFKMPFDLRDLPSRFAPSC